jgi:hypothetical protein
MHRFLAPLALSLTFAAGGAFAQAASAPSPKPAMTAQQSRMGECNEKAGDKKGDERKAFMASCLRNSRTPQQQRMVDCSKQSAGKTGEARQAFMKECLKAPAAASAAKP